MLKKIIALSLSVVIGLGSHAQVLNFDNNFATEGWTYYDNFNSSPSAAFMHNSSSSSLSYSLTKSTETSVLSIPLTDSLGGYGSVFTEVYSASFKITPGSNSNYNSFYPLLLSENFMTGDHKHPWRQNPTNPSIAGPIQDNDMLAVTIVHDEVKIISKKGTAFTLQAFDTPYLIKENIDYWIQMKSKDTNVVTMSVFSDSLLSTTLVTKDFTIESLATFKYLYIANGNGNTATNNVGSLDNYRISKETATAVHSVNNELVSIYPNPASDLLNITLGNGVTKASLQIVNQSGQVVLSQVIGNNATVNVAGLNSGIYHVKVVSEGKSSSTSVFIK